MKSQTQLKPKFSAVHLSKLLGLVVIMIVLLANQAEAQIYTNGNPTWIGGNGKIYTIGAKVGIDTNSPLRGLHLKGAGHRYMRTTSTGGTQYHNYVAGLELQRIKDNGQSIMWDLVNQGDFKIRRNTSTLFQLDLYDAQLGTQTHKTTLNIWGQNMTNSSGTPNNGALALRSYYAGQYKTLRLDGDQIESNFDLHINSQSTGDIDLTNGGGNLRIGTYVEDDAKVSIAAEGIQLKLKNSNSLDYWKIGSSSDNWTVGDGKLVFTNTEASADATMVMTQAGKVGIGMTTPARTLDVAGTTRTTVLEITGGADLAEPFEVSGESIIQPGTIVAIDPANAGQLKMATSAYDKTVAGIVSGAGNIKPGMVMGQDGSIASGEHPVALTGRVYAKVDAQYGAIQPGDLLTTSDTPGHAMRVTDISQAQGAIIGKAMTSLEEGKGLVLVLVSLQ